MAKFSIGQTVKTNVHYHTESKRIFKNDKTPFQGVITDIYDDKKHEVIYFFGKPDKHGNQVGYAEEFLELV